MVLFAPLSATDVSVRAVPASDVFSLTALQVGWTVPDFPEVMTVSTKDVLELIVDPPKDCDDCGGWNPLRGRCQMPVVPLPATQVTCGPTQTHVTGLPPTAV